MEHGLHCSFEDLIRWSAGEAIGVCLDHDLVQVLDGLLDLLCAFLSIQFNAWHRNYQSYSLGCHDRFARLAPCLLDAVVDLRVVVSCDSVQP